MSLLSLANGGTGIRALVCGIGAFYAVRSPSHWFAMRSIGSQCRRTFSSNQDANAPYDVVVFGGNGFVGSNVCKSLVNMGKKVAAINRSGAPSRSEPWMSKVDFIKGDVFNPESWRHVLKGGVGGVVASIGGFGSYEQMKKINGDANIVVTEEAAAAGVTRMVFVSASFPPFPASIPLRGYIEGKQAVEEIVRARFPQTHTILKPSVIFGPQEGAHPLIAAVRALGPIQEPIMTHTPLSKLSSVPVVGGIFLPWSPVHAVANAAAESALCTSPKRVLYPEDINQYK